MTTLAVNLDAYIPIGLIVVMAILFDRLSQAISAPKTSLKLAPDEMLFRLLPQSSGAGFRSPQTCGRSACPNKRQR